MNSSILGPVLIVLTALTVPVARLRRDRAAPCSRSERSPSERVVAPDPWSSGMPDAILWLAR